MFVTASVDSVIVGTWVGGCFLFATEAGDKMLWKVDVNILYVQFGLCLLFFNSRMNFFLLFWIINADAYATHL